MAILKVEIPNGEYCSDKNRLGCIYARHHELAGEHNCTIFDQPIKLRGFKVNGELRMAFEKCDKCKEKNILNDFNSSTIPDRDV